MHASTSCRRRLRDALIPFTLLSLFALLMSLALAAPALADPPGRIGRIAWLSNPGGLTLDNSARGESFRPVVNQPVTSGDVLRTDDNARAEVQIGSTTLRLDAGTSLVLTRIDDDQVKVFLHTGNSIVKLSSPEMAREFELSTQDGRFTTGDKGIFRVAADGNGSSAAAYAGTLHFAAADTDLDIRAGERAEIWFAGHTRYRMSPPERDDFMHWSATRDQRPVADVSSRYVSPEMTGAEDLDAWGDWAESPEYGPLWTPRSVAFDWAPYRSGRWVWVAPWGWNWVGHEPWGFAPFHYGRWVLHRGRWAWVPGAHIARPVYAPALVAWTAAPGAHVSLSFGRAPTSGWFPLAPREVYVPAYRSSRDYVRRVNHTHVTRVEHVDTAIRHPHDAGRPPHQFQRETPPAVSPRPLVRDTQGERERKSAPRLHEQRADTRGEARDDIRDRPGERAHHTDERPHSRPAHSEITHFQAPQPSRPQVRQARDAQAQVVRMDAQRTSARTPEHHTDAARRAQIEDDPRKRRLQREHDERR